jgi:hypothetical protein
MVTLPMVHDRPATPLPLPTSSVDAQGLVLAIRKRRLKVGAKVGANVHSHRAASGDV